MKIAVVAANGRVGQKVIVEALNRGFGVTAFARSENKTAASQFVQKDLFDLTAEDLKGFDAVVDAFGAWTDDMLPRHNTSLKHLCDILSGSDTRLLVVGGTGLYFDLLLHGLDDGERSGTPPEVRARWQRVFTEGGLAALHAEAERRSPGVLARMADPGNPRRVLRVLERLDQGLAPLPERVGIHPDAEAPFPVLGIPAPVLAHRIEKRINAMFDAGLLREVAALRERFPRWSDTAATAIGYAEAAAVLDGTLDEAAARERIAARTRQLAKRQRTWFRNRMNVVWVDGPADAADVPRAADDVERIWRQHGPHPLTLPAPNVV